LSVVQARIPLGWSGDMIGDTMAQLSFRDDALVIDRFVGKHSFGEIQIGGTIRLSNLLDPLLEVTVRSPRLTAPIFKSTEPGAIPVLAASVLDLAIAGPLSAANAKGTATLAALSLGGSPDISRLWSAQRVELPRIFSFPSAPWSQWQFDLTCKTDGPVKLTENPGTIAGNISVTGPGSAPTIAGAVLIENIVTSRTFSRNTNIRSEGSDSLPIVERATVDFVSTRPVDPTIDADLNYTLGGERCWATVTGPLSQLMRTYDGPAPLTDNAVRDAFAGRPWASSIEFSLEIFPPIAIEAGLGPVPLN